MRGIIWIYLILPMLFVWSGKVIAANNVDKKIAAISDLNDALKSRKVFTRQKASKISALQKELSHCRSLKENFDLCKQLFVEYQKYRIDSAIFYAKQQQKAAEALHDQNGVNYAQLELANTYSSIGKFLESAAILKSINIRNLAAETKIYYYQSQIDFYFHYTANNIDPSYQETIERYQDTLINLLIPVSIAYRINAIELLIAKREFAHADKLLELLSNVVKPSSPDYAMITYLKAVSAQRQGFMDEAITLYANSAEADVRNAIRDNASLQELAVILFNLGDIDQAYRYTNIAIEDAIFCDVKFRTLHISKIYSIINSSYSQKENHQKKQLQSYLALISLLSICLLVGLVLLYRQMQKISRIKAELDTNSQQLAMLNSELKTVNMFLSKSNSRLTEANTIKETYITQFFDLCSTYINKLEAFRKTLHKKAIDKHWEELTKLLRSNNLIKQEVDELYEIFDTIFLKLYPTFVDEFNLLLNPSEKIVRKPGELLTTELRIYALVRLGISDSNKIAAFLRYSTSTIYNYRTSARNKAAGQRENFEELVMMIGIDAQETK